MVTKYPLGTMEGGLAACKRGGRRSNERTNGRTKGIVRAGWKERWRWWLPAVLIIVPPLSFWCSGLPGAECLNVSLQSKYRLPWLCPRKDVAFTAFTGAILHVTRNLGSLCRGNQVSTLNIRSGASKIVDGEVLGIFSD